MAKDKYKDKEQLVDEMMKMYEDRHNKKWWNNNDAFDVACWFLGVMIMSIEEDHLIPREELQQRIKQRLDELVDKVFQQIEDLEKDSQKSK
jgi:hypothetical protein